MNYKIVKLILIIFFVFLFLFLYLKIFKKESPVELTKIEKEEIIESSSSNIIENVRYVSKDKNGNEYIVTALKGEIDYSKSNIIYLTSVKALMKLSNSSEISISSDYGKYNINNFDTIFSENVKIKYPNNIISSDYLDFSINKNLMLISKNVIYKNFNNVLNADVIEVNLLTKDVKIFMYDKDKNISIKGTN